MFATLQAIDRKGKPKRSSLNERFQTKDTNNVDSKQLLIKINEMQVNQNESRGLFDEFHWHQFRKAKTWGLQWFLYWEHSICWTDRKPLQCSLEKFFDKWICAAEGVPAAKVQPAKVSFRRQTQIEPDKPGTRRKKNFVTKNDLLI